MRKVIIFKILILCGVVYFDISCKDQNKETIMNSCPPPAGECIDSDSIDWENYNSVVTVYVNNELECSNPKIAINNGKTIKIYGWLMKKDNALYITYDSLYATGQTEYMTAFTIPIYSASDFDSYDLTKKCYLRGELKLENTQNDKGVWCCVFSPRIILKEITDVFFEEE